MPLSPNHSPVQPKALILGIESSCDETAASLIVRDASGETRILSSIIASQDEQHAPFGGVVPEIAARAHIQKIDLIITEAMEEAAVDYTDLSAIAATAGPGLIGGVIAGLMSAKGLALSLDIPLIAVNHLEGHALSPRLAAPCPFPYLLLLVSGGHSQLLAVKSLGDYERLGSTVDDAAGEAFDKTAKVMGLGFPGGPNVERVARSGNPKAVSLPRPYKGKPHADFSFAGLKTAVARAYATSPQTEEAKADIAASFQQAVCDVLTDRTGRAMDIFAAMSEPGERRFVVAGGVASNQAIRSALNMLCETRGYTLSAPPLEFCTDNAAMIALAGLEHYLKGQCAPLDVKARPRWPLDAGAAASNPASGFGKNGPKA
ncbi:MAG: tRNA (adenosine(37)-N6)-threonylcarbamoyltransferase complex transferase subunit TsaD [Alphaproteobacteria bacterium]